MRAAHKERVSLSAHALFKTPAITGWDAVKGGAMPYHYFTFGAGVCEVSWSLHDQATTIHKAGHPSATVFSLFEMHSSAALCLLDYAQMGAHACSHLG